MKQIIAVIKPNMLDDVIFALHKIAGFPGGTVADVAQIGTGHDAGKLHAGFDLPEAKRLEIICDDPLVEDIVQTIAREAHTGLSGDGHVAVSPINNAVDIGCFKPPSSSR